MKLLNYNSAHKNHSGFDTEQSIAIVGLSCRLPGQVLNINDLWKLLLNGQNAVTQIPEHRWNIGRFSHPERKVAGKSCTYAGGIIEDIEQFDHEFFGISRNEAESMDFQQKLMLELTWESLEDAQIPPSSISDSQCGVYIGASSIDSSLNRTDDPCFWGPYFMLGTAISGIANRISYIYNLHGPSLVIDTACSSAMVAIHHACQALIEQKLPLALAGGINLLYSPYPYIGFTKSHMLSKDGRCKVFDSQGNGYARAEGGGVFVLKTLDRALQDQDRIYAVIRKTGVNSDGRTAGLALPNQKAQIDLLNRIYDLDREILDRLFYVEAHGTGTAAGDPIEAGAIGKVLGQSRNQHNPLWIGSVKSNLGHLEPASGVAGLLKGILVLQHKKIPANLNLNNLNPDIDFKGLNIKPVTQLTKLPENPGPKLVGVNSFGFGGTNAHILLEEPAHDPSPIMQATYRENSELPPLFLSARSSNSLKKLTLSYMELVQNADINDYLRIAGSAALGRDHLQYRMLACGKTPAQIAAQLSSFVSGQNQSEAEPCIAEAVGECVQTAFVYSGNGSQWPGMAADLLGALPAFDRIVDRADAFLKPLLGWSVRQELAKPLEMQRLYLTEVAQPLLFVLQIGLTRTMQDKGFVPSAVYGHSVGEVSAAYACGALSMEQACQVIYYRSYLQGKTRNLGKMAAVNISIDQALQLEELKSGLVEIGAENSSNSITLTGTQAALTKLEKRLVAQGIFFKLLDFDYPFHSQFMDRLKNDFYACLKDLKPGKSNIKYISTVTGQEIDGQNLDVDYWWDNIRKPVQFAAATRTLLDIGVKIFLEIGPHAVLRYYINECVKAKNSSARILPSLKKGENGKDLFERCWQNAYLNGFIPDMQKMFPGQERALELPTYPWDKQDFQVQPTLEHSGFISGQKENHPLLGYQYKDFFLWESDLDPVTHPFLADHCIAGKPVFPAAAYIETALAAAFYAHDRQYQELENLAFQNMLFLFFGEPKLLRTSIDPEDGYFRMESRTRMSKESWTLNCTGKIVSKCACQSVDRYTFVDDPQSFGSEQNIEALYKLTDKIGLEYGYHFKSIKQAWIKDNQILAAVDAVDESASADMNLPPALIDAAFQSLFALVYNTSANIAENLYLPTWISNIKVFKKGSIAFAHTVLEKRLPRSLSASFTFLDQHGQVLVSMSGCRCSQVQSVEKLRDRQQLFRVHAFPMPHDKDFSPAPLARPEEIKSEIYPFFYHLAGKIDRKEYYEELIPFCKAIVLSLARELIAKLHKPEGFFSVENLINQNTIAPYYRHYLLYLLNLLTVNNLALKQEGLWTLKDQDDFFNSTQLLRTLSKDYPAFLAETLMLTRISMHLPDIVCGLTSFAEILGMEKNSALENYYTNSLSSSLLNNTLARLFKTILNKSNSRRLKIIELGAGPGATLAYLLPVLPRHLHEYYATDKDIAMVEYMRSKWENQSVFKFEQLDIQNISQEQFQELGTFDIVLAGHALSQVNDLNKALNNCQKLLEPGGMLVLTEFAPTALSCFIFGIDPKFWELSPDEHRPAPRLQTEDMWRKNLEDSGFLQIQTLIEPDVPEPDSFMLLAQKSKIPQTSSISEQLHTDAEKTWIVLQDEQASSLANYLGTEICTELNKHGFKTVQLKAGENMVWSVESQQSINPFSCRQWEELLTFYHKNNISIELINLIGFDPRQEISAREFSSILRAGNTVPAMLFKAGEKLRSRFRLWLLAAGSLNLKACGTRPVPSQGGVWGLARVLGNESQGLDIRVLDIHGSAQKDIQTDQVLRELLYPAKDREVVLAKGNRYVSRLNHYSGLPPGNEAINEHNQRVTLEFSALGSPENLYWEKKPRLKPGPDEVEIQNQAAGLNFRDVMYTLGYLPEEALEDGFSGPTLGLECSGEVTAIGENISDIHIGDKVLALSGSCYNSHILAAKEAVFQKPENWKYHEAASIPVAFFTAYYALQHLARLEPGESILIHGGAGGVGLAAIQIANYLGAEIYATAGTTEKRDFLQLSGVDHVFDSRSLHFGREILKQSNGQGVDAVLNCLSGEALNKSLALLKPFGRFLELGKRDILADSALRMRLMRQNISFFCIDVNQIMKFRPQTGRRLLQEILDLCQQDIFRPLPHSVFKSSCISSAFKAMQESRHIGKIVISYDESVQQSPVYPEPGQRTEINPRGSYLITGGLGGLGLAAASRLLQRGARHLILLSRKGLNTAAKKQAVNNLQARGAEVQIVKTDIANYTSMASELTKALSNTFELKGVLHCASTLHDALISKQSPQSFDQVLGPKASGAWNLHLYTKDMHLDHFILFSSATTVFGNPGQSNYVAANAALETLAVYRRSLGLPAQAIAWGPVSDTGMLLHNQEALHTLKKSTGIRELSSVQVMDHLDALLLPDQYPVLAVFKLDWQTITRFAWAKTPFFEQIPELDRARTESAEHVQIKDLLIELDSAEGISLLADQICEELAAILRSPASKIKRDIPVKELGMDSLMGVELTVSLEKRFNLNNQASISFGQSTTVRQLAAGIYEQLINTDNKDQTGEVLKNMKQHGLDLDLQRAEELIRITDREIASANKGRLLK